MNKKVKIVLKDAHFDGEDPEVSYTTSDKGGAASGKNEAYLFKSMQHESEGSQEQSHDTNSNADIVSKSQKETNEDNMSDEKLQEQIEAQAKIIKQLMDEKKVDQLSGYGLDETLINELVESAEDVTLITKALDVIVSAKGAEREQAVNKALETKNPETEESKLEKTLSEEQGHTEKEEPVVTDTLLKQYQQFKKTTNQG